MKTLCQRNIACSAKGRTAEICCARQRTGVLWHWLTCLFMGLTVQSCPKGLFMERAVFTACRSPGGAGAPVTVLSQVPTDSHHKYQKQGLAEISVAKATFQTVFQASSDFLTTQTTCLLTIPANSNINSKATKLNEWFNHSCAPIFLPSSSTSSPHTCALRQLCSKGDL